MLLLLPLVAIFLAVTALIGHMLESYQRARIHAALPEAMRPLVAPFVPPA